MTIAFLMLAAVALAGACATMMLRGLVHCALALAVAFAGIGALYIYLGAQFLGLAQLLVYVGAVAVLIVFVILLTRAGESDAPRPMRGYWAQAKLMTGSLLAAALFAVLAWTIFHSGIARGANPQGAQPDIRALGTALMEGYVFPLEVIGLMLTAALIGAAIVAMKERVVPEKGSDASQSTA